MSVYIKGMEMPTSCYDCSFSVEAYEGSGVYSCVITDNCVCKGAERHDDCPLIPVPEHGRLIDADALIGKLHDECLFDYDARSVVYADIQDAPTIIPADKEGET